MTKFEATKRAVRDSATRLNHKLSQFHSQHLRGKLAGASAHCTKCQGAVYVRVTGDIDGDKGRHIALDRCTA
jgi:hypothetical protein